MRAQAGESRAELEAKLAALERENAVLHAREDASRAREAASSRIFQAIAAGPEEAARAFDLIAESAALLCGAYDAVVLLLRDDHLVRGGHYGPIPTDIKSLPVSPRWTAGRCVLERRPVHVHDLLSAGGEFPDGAALALRLGHRTIVSVPLLHGDEAVGSITLRRFEVSPFTEDEIALLATFADQAVIAIGNTRLFSELHESLRQQTATADVLKAISQSAFDLPTVLDALLGSAAGLCQADIGTIRRRIGDSYELAATYGSSAEWRTELQRYSTHPDRGSVFGRVIIERQTIHIPDVLKDPEFTRHRSQKMAGIRAALGVPLVRDGTVVGVVVLFRFEPGSFSRQQIELVQTFADQAVIAIENTRLLNDLRGALQQQTAMADVLRAISRTTFDLRNVLATLVQAALRLCEADQGTIARERDGEFVRVSSHGFSPEFMAAVLDRPIVLDRGSVTGRALVERRLVHIPDVALDPDYDFAEALQHGGFRTLVGVPLLRDGAAIGVLALSRKEARPFTEKQMELLASVADQAAVAIENARLFEAVQRRTAELEKALEQQTATSAILRVIASSPADLAPVLEAVAENAARLCGAADAQIFRVHGDVLYLEASFGSIPIHFREAEISRGWVTGRAVVDRRTIHIHDLAAEPQGEFPLGRGMQSQHGHRTTLATPLLKQGIVLGAILIRRMEVNPFSDDQIRLLETFADQAVIAIENARLFGEVEGRTRELQEALDHQTATTKILQVIGRSPSDAQPVFEAIVDAGRQLFPNAAISITLREGDSVVAAAVAEREPDLASAFRRLFPIPLDRRYMHSRAIMDGVVVDIPDAALAPADMQPGAGNFLRSGYRAVTIVPMFRGDRAIGALSVVRVAAGALDDRQRDLVSTFASQAVIAIENARLFEALETAIAEFHAVLDNIDYGVLFMDKDLRTRIVNPALRRLWDIPQELIDQRPTMRELLEYNRDRGVYTTLPEDWDEWVARRIERVRQGDVPPGEFIRADGKVYSYQCVALPDGGRMLSYFDITELKHRQAALLAAKEAAEMALAELRTAQERLVQSEKLASLGQLTAGIAHEIKNPLNFVNNFASLSDDLLAELEAVLQAPFAALDACERDDAEDLFRTVRENLKKIARHGKRADSIVKNMLLHARQGTGEWRQADINAIAEEALNLAYHGARAGHPDFNVEIVKHLDDDAGAIECCPQDIMRVVLNLVSNGIYAANQRRPSAPAGFVPRIELTTRAEDAGITIEVLDNGTGIPADLRESIFLPFFTTKPAGEGTGLGLSLSHDIVVKQHGGLFSVESEPGAFTLFRVVLPRHATPAERAEA